MRELLDWSRDVVPCDSEWLMLGKGPSLAKLESCDTENYFKLTLNHVIRDVPATVAHMIDIEALKDCRDVLLSNADYVVMPWYPHSHFKPGKKTLEDYCGEIPVLAELALQGRLVWYNLHTGPPRAGSPIIRAIYFSAEAGLGLLAAIGVRSVRSLGVDGGVTYCSHFQDLEDSTLLKNGRPSFDLQFEGVARVIQESGIFYAPLDDQAPIRVFVGTDDTQMAGLKVLEYSIRQYASMSVEVLPIDNKGIPVPRNPDNRARTGFSFSRFDIPRRCDYKGRAIYLDADMQLFDDIAKLWRSPMHGSQVLYSESVDRGQRIPQYSVMLIDCERARWDVNEMVASMDRGEIDYRDLMYNLCVVPDAEKRGDLQGEWNSLERFQRGKTKLLHYTDMPTQPWVSRRNRNGKLWYKCLREAVEGGYIAKSFLAEEIRAGHVSPMLPCWAGLDLGEDFSALTQQWTPPYLRFSEMRNSSNWNGPEGFFNRFSRVLREFARR